MKYENDVRKILSEFKTNILVDIINLDDNLELIGINSLLFVSLIVKIEEKFNISFTDENLLLNRTGTIRALCSQIYNLLEE